MENQSAGISQDVGMSSDACNQRQQTVLLVGKVGDGKSTLHNMLIFSDPGFSEDAEVEMGTNASSVSEKVVSSENEDWAVIDTIGLGQALTGTKTGTDVALKRLREFFADKQMAVDHICYVMRKGEFTEYQEVYWKHFWNLFGRNKKHIRLIFTSAGAKWLSDNKTAIKELVGDYPMIAVDFPPRANNSDDEDRLRTKRAKSLKSLKEFLDEQKGLTDQPAIITLREASSSGQDPVQEESSSRRQHPHKKEASSPRQHPVKVVKQFVGGFRRTSNP